MAVTIRYEPNNSDFGRLMMADQTQSLALDAAHIGVTYARAYAAGMKLPADYIASIKAEAGPPVILGGRNPRRTARIVAEHRLGGAIEFGTGTKSGGNDGRGRPREQGGYSSPYRILGRAGARVGSPPRGS